MARSKVTTTIDSDKLAEARRLLGVRNVSDTIDQALDRLIRDEQLKRDVAAYIVQPPTEAEIGFASQPPSYEDLADETDWEAVYQGI